MSAPDVVIVDDGTAGIVVQVDDDAAIAVSLIDPVTVIELTPIGYPGEQGPPGPAGGIVAFEHVQSSAATTWTIAHNLGVRPVVSVTTTGGLQMLGNVVYLSDLTLQITFAVAVAGVARCV